MRTRVPVLAVVTILASTVAFAQAAPSSPHVPVPTAPPIAATVPPIAATDVPGMMQDVDRFRAAPDTYAPRYGQPVPPPPTGGVVYSPWGPWPRWAEARRAEPTVVSDGYLALQVVPVTAEVYIDGLYVGTVNDVRGEARGEALAPGPHRLELRAPGYQPVALDLRIVPGRTTIYRGDLALRPPAPTPAPPATGAIRSKAFYVIPGCYAGDKRPDVARLPRGCDASKLRTVPPVVTRVEPPAPS